MGITVQRYPTRDVVLHNYRVPAGVSSTGGLGGGRGGVSQHGGVPADPAPPQTLCQVSLYAMGRSPAVFPHPERYEPARWLGGERAAFKALAFGFGARQCIGRRLAEAEMMLFLLHVS